MILSHLKMKDPKFESAQNKNLTGTIALWRSMEVEIQCNSITVFYHI